MPLIWCYPWGSVAHQLWLESAICVPFSIFIMYDKQESVVTFEFLMPVLLKIRVFWNISVGWLRRGSRCFKGTLIHEMSETAHLTYCHIPEDCLEDTVAQEQTWKPAITLCIEPSAVRACWLYTVNIVAAAWYGKVQDLWLSYFITWGWSLWFYSISILYVEVDS